MKTMYGMMKAATVCPNGRQAPARPRASDRDHERRRDRPDGLLTDVAHVVGGQHRVPRADLGDGDHGHQEPADPPAQIVAVVVAGGPHHQSPLRHEGQLGDGGDRASDHHARPPPAERRDPLDVGARQDRPERAPEHEQRRQPQQLSAVPRDLRRQAGRLTPQPPGRSDPGGDVCNSDDTQQPDPERDRGRGAVAHRGDCSHVRPATATIARETASSRPSLPPSTARATASGR